MTRVCCGMQRRHGLGTWQILSSPSANENDRVLLQVVAFARNVGDDGPTCAQFYFRDFAYSRIGLLGLDGVDFRADAFLLI